MFIIDLRNKLVSDYRFSVINNSNVDVVNIYSHFIQYRNYSIYLKVRSDDETYVDKIAIPSENISVDEDTLVVKWTMGAVSTQCKKIYLQLQFEDGEDIIAQSRIVSIVLGDTIDVSHEIEPIYPDILKSLQEQIDTLRHDSYALSYLSFNNDILLLEFENIDAEQIVSLQANIPLSQKTSIVAIDGTTMIQDLPSTCVIVRGAETYLFHKKLRLNSIYDVYVVGGGFKVETSTNKASLIEEVIDDEDNRTNYVDIDTLYDNYYNKESIDTMLATIKRNHYIAVDTDTYPTLADFLASTGVEGNLYLYPLDIADLTKGYHQYIWESDSWLYMGDTNLDLTPYPTFADIVKNQATTTIIKSPLENINGKVLTTYEATLITIPASYTYYEITHNGQPCSYEDAEEYFNRMSGTKFVPTYNYDYPRNSLWLTANGTLLKPQFSEEDGLRLYVIPMFFYKNNEDLVPVVNATYNIGSGDKKFNNGYFAGALVGNSLSASVNDLCSQFNPIGSGGTEIKWSKCHDFIKSEDTTFTFETYKSGCRNEYKATISNASASPIVLTFTGIHHILCNDDNCVINGNQLTLPAYTNIEINAFNQELVAINFSAN